MDVTSLIDRYVAVWNEPNAAVRRRGIAALWQPDGATCHRLIEARGYPELETRVGDAQDKWVRAGGYRFRSCRNAVAHHGVVRFNWEMVAPDGGEVASVGLDFLMLEADGRIRCAYQFNQAGGPESAEADALVARYVAMWNQPDADRRRAEIAALWAEDGVHVTAAAERHGHDAIAAEAADAYGAYVAKGFAFCAARPIDGHHDVIRFEWELAAADGTAATRGATLLQLDVNRRVRRDYQFDLPPAGAG